MKVSRFKAALDAMPPAEINRISDEMEWIDAVFGKLTAESRKAVIQKASELLRSEEGRA
jgi:hypothetical protein